MLHNNEFPYYGNCFRGVHMLMLSCLFETPCRLGSQIFRMKRGRRQGCLVNLTST